MSKGRKKQKTDRRIWAVSAMMYLSVVMKKVLSWKAKLKGNTIDSPVFYVSFLTYELERWVVTERMRLQIQVAEIKFLQRVAGLAVKDRVRSSVI